MRIIQANQSQNIKKIMQDIQVDPYGIRIMLPKALNFLVKLDSISNITANILKQEMLSLGADAAVARGALTGKTRKTDCLLIGNYSQFNRLKQKLKKQPFGLDKLAKDLSGALENYQKDDFTLELGRKKLNLGKRTAIMGIVNVTPDSFSGDGICQGPRIIEYAKQLVKDGADIIDVGGESSRPGAKPVPLKEEIERTIPAIKSLAKIIKAPISIDTCKPDVAKAALDNGAVIVNDISGLRNPKMSRIISRYKAGVVIMHMKGNPRNMQKNPSYASLLDEIIGFLNSAVEQAVASGIKREKIIIDPGIGFGKTWEHNLEILNSLKEFKILGLPILVGPARKAFIGKILNAAPGERTFGTVSACVLAAKNGAKIVRVHDVKAVAQALRVQEAIDNL